MNSKIHELPAQLGYLVATVYVLATRDALELSSAATKQKKKQNISNLSFTIEWIPIYCSDITLFVTGLTMNV
jgi:hypothetical protein